MAILITKNFHTFTATTLLLAYLIIDIATAAPTFGDEFVHIKVHVPGEEIKQKHYHSHSSHHHIPPPHKVIHHYHQHPKPFKRKHHAHNDALLESIVLADLKKPKFEHDFEASHVKPSTTIVLEEEYYHKPKEEYKTYTVIHDTAHDDDFKPQTAKYLPSNAHAHAPSYKTKDYIETVKVSDEKLPLYQADSSTETDDHLDALAPYLATNYKYTHHTDLAEEQQHMAAIEHETELASAPKQPHEYTYKTPSYKANADLELKDYADVFQHTSAFNKGAKHYYKTTRTPDYEYGKYLPKYSANDFAENSSFEHDTAGYSYHQHHPKNSLHSSGSRKEFGNYGKVPFTLANERLPSRKPSSYVTKSVVVTSTGHSYPTGSTEYYNTANDTGYETTHEQLGEEEDEEEDKRSTYRGVDSYNADHVQGLGSGVYKYSPPFL